MLAYPSSPQRFSSRQYLAPLCNTIESVILLAHHIPTLGALYLPFSAHMLQISPGFFLGWFLVCIGTTIRLRCYSELGKLFTFKIQILKDHKLITSGPYSVVRHPSYTSAIICGIGLTILQFSKGSLLSTLVQTHPIALALALLWGLVYGVLTPVLMTQRVLLEDRLLKEVFQEEWVVYSKQTPYALVPFLF